MNDALDESMVEIDQDACELLDADHLAVKHLFVAYARLAVLRAMAGPQAAGLPDDRLALARAICTELTVHARIEEEIFYPALRDASPAAAALLDAAHTQHDEAKALIAQIEAMAEPSPEMDETVEQLARAIEAHVKEERDHLFPKARSAQALDLYALASDLRDRQEALEAGGQED